MWMYKDAYFLLVTLMRATLLDAGVVVVELLDLGIFFLVFLITIFLRIGAAAWWMV